MPSWIFRRFALSNAWRSRYPSAKRKSCSGYVSDATGSRPDPREQPASWTLTYPAYTAVIGHGTPHPTITTTLASTVVDNSPSRHRRELTGVLDAARAENLSVLAALERLFAFEVENTQARRLAGGCGSRACPRHRRWPGSTPPRNPALTKNSSPSWARCGSSTTLATSCLSARPVVVNTASPSVRVCQIVQWVVCSR
jgi:hypothetical protein